MKCFVWVAAGLCLTVVTCHAEETAERRTGLRVGADLYYGVSNTTGPVRRLTDGQWAGVGSLNPSVLSLQWSGERRGDAMVSLGIGDMYVGGDRTTQQPVECWYKCAVGNGSLSLGKHYTPFALQEWEYETRWGALYEHEAGRGTVALSTAYNRDTRAMNSMMRLGYAAGAGTTVGVSASAGRGWSYSTSHAWGYAVDATVEKGAVTLSGEFVEGRGRNGTFQFAFAKVATEVGKGCRPYVAGYYVHDVADEMGDFRSGILGIELDVARHCVLEPGIGRANGRNVWWVQAHVTF